MKYYYGTERNIIIVLTKCECVQYLGYDHHRHPVCFRMAMEVLAVMLLLALLVLATHINTSNIIAISYNHTAFIAPTAIDFLRSAAGGMTDALRTAPRLSRGAPNAPGPVAVFT